MPHGNTDSQSDRDKLIEFKAEVKSDLKYLRIDSSNLQKAVEELTKKINAQCTELAVLKAKVAIYAGFVAAATSIIVAIITSLLRG